MDSIGPASGGNNVDHRKEVSFDLFEACRQPSHVLHGADEAFDVVSGGIETGVVRYRAALVALHLVNWIA